MGAFLAVSGGEVLEAAAEALSFYGVAAELAAEAAEAQGPGSFQTLFLNQLSLVTPEQYSSRSRLKLLEA